MDDKTFDELTMNSARDKLGPASQKFVNGFYELITEHFGTAYGAMRSEQRACILEGIKTGHYHRIRNSKSMQDLFQSQEAVRLLKALNKFDQIRSVGDVPETIEEPDGHSINEGK